MTQIKQGSRKLFPFMCLLILALVLGLGAGPWASADDIPRSGTHQITDSQSIPIVASGDDATYIIELDEFHTNPTDMYLETGSYTAHTAFLFKDIDVPTGSYVQYMTMTYEISPQSEYFAVNEEDVRVAFLIGDDIFAINQANLATYDYNDFNNFQIDATYFSAWEGVTNKDEFGTIQPGGYSSDINLAMGYGYTGDVLVIITTTHSTRNLTILSYDSAGATPTLNVYASDGSYSGVPAGTTYVDTVSGYDIFSGVAGMNFVTDGNWTIYDLGGVATNVIADDNVTIEGTMLGWEGSFDSNGQPAFLHGVIDEVNYRGSYAGSYETFEVRGRTLKVDSRPNGGYAPDWRFVEINALKAGDNSSVQFGIAYQSDGVSDGGVPRLWARGSVYPGSGESEKWAISDYIYWKIAFDTQWVNMSAWDTDPGDFLYNWTVSPQWFKNLEYNFGAIWNCTVSVHVIPPTILQSSYTGWSDVDTDWVQIAFGEAIITENIFYVVDIETGLVASTVEGDLDDVLAVIEVLGQEGGEDGEVGTPYNDGFWIMPESEGMILERDIWYEAVATGGDTGGSEFVNQIQYIYDVNGLWITFTWDKTSDSFIVDENDYARVDNSHSYGAATADPNVKAAVCRFLFTSLVGDAEGVDVYQRTQNTALNWTEWIKIKPNYFAIGTIPDAQAPTGSGGLNPEPYIPPTLDPNDPFGEMDTDGDGIPDSQDDDIDGDGIPNHLDPDANGDGIPDEYNIDTDGDGIPDFMDDDDDGDGIPDILDRDDDGDGIPDEHEKDTDGDGIRDDWDGDIDGDGIPNHLDSDPFHAPVVFEARVVLTWMQENGYLILLGLIAIVAFLSLTSKKDRRDAMKAIDPSQITFILGNEKQ